jgi:hypothetical protein
MERGKTGRVAALACAVGLALGAGARAGDLYRCQRADGSLFYTDDASDCPGRDPHELTGQLQSVPTPRPPAARARAGADPALEQRLAEVEAARWRQRRDDAMQQLHEAEQRVAYLRGFATQCSHGRNVVSEDADGVRTPLRCVDLRAELAALEQKADALRTHLDEGLPEECRRAGCLPGWLR